MPTPPFGKRGYAIAATVSTGRAYAGTGWQAPSVSTFFEDWWEFMPPSTAATQINNTEPGINCYPNPCINELNVVITGKNEPGFSYEIYAITGRKLLTGTLSGNIINTSSLPAGQYLLVVKGAGQVYRSVFATSKNE